MKSIQNAALGRILIGLVEIIKLEIENRRLEEKNFIRGVLDQKFYLSPNRWIIASGDIWFVG